MDPFSALTLYIFLKDIESTQRALQKKYWALVIGTPRLSKGRISASLAKVDLILVGLVAIHSLFLFAVKWWFMAEKCSN